MINEEDEIEGVEGLIIAKTWDVSVNEREEEKVKRFGLEISPEQEQLGLLVAWKVD